MALGVDLYAAEIVLNLKAKYPHITLESAIPCETQAVKWSVAARERYYNIAAKCDKETMLQREYTSDCKAFWNHRHCRWFSLYKKRADSEQVQIRSLLDWKLFQSELYTRGRIVHPEEDGCDLAADNGAVGVEGTLLVRAGQDARTIECVNFIRTLVA
ncbi:MAG: SLOG family protein, partial [Enterobacteriaceae bacterium]